RKKHPRFQEELSPFPGENGRQHPLLQETATRHGFLRCYTIIPLPVSRQLSPFPGGIIPISRRIGSPCSGGLIAPFPLTGKSIIPVSRITEKKLGWQTKLKHVRGHAAIITSP